jgi:hypothetical protein
MLSKQNDTAFSEGINYQAYFHSRYRNLPSLQRRTSLSRLLIEAKTDPPSPRMLDFDGKKKGPRRARFSEQRAKSELNVDRQIITSAQRIEC